MKSAVSSYIKVYIHTYFLFFTFGHDEAGLLAAGDVSHEWNTRPSHINDDSHEHVLGL